MTSCQIGVAFNPPQDGGIAVDANTANFNQNGRLCVANVGSRSVTLTAVSGQTVNGGQSVSIAPNRQQCVKATVADPNAAGADWVASP